MHCKCAVVLPSLAGAALLVSGRVSVRFLARAFGLSALSSPKERLSRERVCIVICLAKKAHTRIAHGNVFAEGVPFTAVFSASAETH